ncbi:transposase [Tenacibaculum maritimum]
MSKTELYTTVTNKKAKGKAGSIVGTKAEQVIQYLYKTPSFKPNKVKKITLDMAHSMKLVAKRCFPKSVQVTDKFHV